MVVMKNLQILSQLITRLKLYKLNALKEIIMKKEIMEYVAIGNTLFKNI